MPPSSISSVRVTRVPLASLSEGVDVVGLKRPRDRPVGELRVGLQLGHFDDDSQGTPEQPGAGPDPGPHPERTVSELDGLSDVTAPLGHALDGNDIGEHVLHGTENDDAHLNLPHPRLLNVPALGRRATHELTAPTSRTNPREGSRRRGAAVNGRSEPPSGAHRNLGGRQPRASRVELRLRPGTTIDTRRVHSPPVPHGRAVPMKAAGGQALKRCDGSSPLIAVCGRDCMRRRLARGRPQVVHSLP